MDSLRYFIPCWVSLSLKSVLYNTCQSHSVFWLRSAVPSPLLIAYCLSVSLLSSSLNQWLVIFFLSWGPILGKKKCLWAPFCFKKYLYKKWLCWAKMEEKHFNSFYLGLLILMSGRLLYFSDLLLLLRELRTPFPPSSPISPSVDSI